MDITYGTSWHEFLHPYNRAGLPSAHRTRRSFVYRRGELLQLHAVVPVLACRAAATCGTWRPKNGLHCFRAACLLMPQTRSPPIQSVGSTRWQLVLRAMRHMAMNAMAAK